MSSMEDIVQRVTLAMMEYDALDPKRIHHFLKVHAFSRTIAVEEGLDDALTARIELAALVHDIGIKRSEQKYGSASGHYQEMEGPSEAKTLLDACGVMPAIIARICYLVGHHHTYADIDGIDYQILVEADFLVNIAEEPMDKPHAMRVYERIFKTETGKKLFRLLYGV